MKKEIIAETFTPRYDAGEDRIRLVVNYQNLDTRVDLMLTRAFILKFIPAFDDYMFQYYNDEVVDDFASGKYTELQSKKIKDKEKNREIQQEKNIVKTDNVNMKLYEKEPELVTKIDFIYDKKSTNTTLVFCTKTTEVKTVFTASTLQQLIKTIKNAIPNFSWGIAQNF